ncbi:MAG: HlyD family efflux transporter periplasmic adaptor subunit, partial [Actinomycetia bacterium]|nr:HlyD family efflux transporter periplasmic adaptor subunit [Actinomycetes bacterium]
VLVAALLLPGCSSDEGPVIETGAVERQTVVETVEAPASVVAAATAVVTASANGTVSRVVARDGQQVQRGDVLFVVSSPEAEQRLAQAQQSAAGATAPVTLPQASTGASAAQAAAAAEQAFAQARDAAKQLQDKNLRQQALQQVAAAEAQLAAAQAQAQSTVDQINSSVSALEQSLATFTQAQQAQAQVAVRSAQQAVDALTVKAPIAGRVVFGASAGSGGGGSDISGLVDQLPSSLAGQAESLLGGGGSESGGSGSTTGIVSAGSPVSDGDPVLTITDTSLLTLRAEVDETDVLLVRKGVKADVELDAVAGARYRAVVRNVDLSPTTSSRGGVSYVVRLDLGGGTLVDGSPAPRPRPGMSAVASLRVLTSDGVVAVPVASVFRDGEQDAVWVVQDNVPEKRIVTLGAQGEEYLEIVDGVTEGENIVVRGADQVVDGEELP